MLTPEKEKYLKRIYFDPGSPASFSGLNKFYNYVKKQSHLRITLTDIKKWLSKQDSYTAHRSLRRKFKRPKVLSFSKNYMYDADTAILSI